MLDLFSNLNLILTVVPLSCFEVFESMPRRIMSFTSICFHFLGVLELSRFYNFTIILTAWQFSSLQILGLFLVHHCTDQVLLYHEHTYFWHVFILVLELIGQLLMRSSIREAFCLFRFSILMSGVLLWVYFGRLRVFSIISLNFVVLFQGFIECVPSICFFLSRWWVHFF